MTTHDENPIIKTTTRRMAKGLAIIVIMMAVGAAIAVPNWHNFAKNPPPVSSITTSEPAGPVAGCGAQESSEEVAQLLSQRAVHSLLQHNRVPQP